MNTYCSICGSIDEVRHLNLYVSGSEGVELCQACYMGLVEYVRNARAAAGRAVMVTIKSVKKEKRAIQEAAI